MAPGGFERGGALDPELKTNVSGRRWLLGMILVAASYVVIGVVFAALISPHDRRAPVALRHTARRSAQ